MSGLNPSLLEQHSLSSFGNMDDEEGVGGAPIIREEGGGELCLAVDCAENRPNSGQSVASSLAVIRGISSQVLLVLGGGGDEVCFLSGSSSGEGPSVMNT